MKDFDTSASRVQVRVVKPMIAEYEHVAACQRALSSIYLSGASSPAQEEAKNAVLKTLAALPIGAGERQIQDAKEAALAPFATAIAAREKAKELEAEQQRKRSNAEFTATLYLDHIGTYLEREYEWKSYSEMASERDRLRPLIKAALVEELMRRDMSAEEIRRRIERLCRKL